ncbi:MAG: hypothetical protein M3367_13380 [Acidobacteriota bacterium]|nr:hypothetical protein [Acidobacteriota bacterium]
MSSLALSEKREKAFRRSKLSDSDGRLPFCGGITSGDAYAPIKSYFFEMKQKTEITFEVEETTVLRQEVRKFEAFCPQCQTLVEMFAPQIAAALSGLSEREIFRLIENERVHFVETDRVFVCRNSLMKSEPPTLADGLSND